MIRCMFILSFLFAFQPPPLSYEQQVAAMEADYAAQPDKASVKYLSAHSLPEAIRAADIGRFILPHLSQQQLLEYCLPVEIPGTRFYRIDLVGLRWTKGWPAVVKNYPYDSSTDPLVVRLDWLLAETANRKSEAYYDLLYGEVRHAAKPAPSKRGQFPTSKPAPDSSKFPATGAEFFAFWHVDPKAFKSFTRAHIIETGESGVAVGDAKRVIESYRSAFGAYRTFDSEKGDGDKNPLLDLSKPPAHDAGELIVQMPKQTKDGKEVAAQAYLLVDGKDARVNVADTFVVVNNTDPRQPAIVNFSSCVRCHTTGILSLPRNMFRGAVAGGLELKAKSKEERDALELRVLADLTERIEGHQDEFARFIAAVTELTAGEVIGDYGKAVDFYGKPLDLAQVAVEVYAEDADEMKLALGLYGERLGGVHPDLAAVVAGAKITRSEWEKSLYREASAALAAWRAK